ncbi:MAG TPA: MFS transporter [Ktedonosporobacter sp.]|nr:MFS transporter [Ktedonosporobacter sp.]
MRKLTMSSPARLAILVACTAVFLTALDQTVVVTALPQMILDLQIPIGQLDRAAWIISGYLLGYVIAMPLMGRVSDIYGRRRVFLICLGVFAFGSLFCGLAPLLGNAIDISFLKNVGIDVNSQGLIWLVAARFIQAAGGGAVVPVAMAVAGDFYGWKERALMLGLIGMVTEAGGVLGPLYGSVIVQSLGWQYIFYLNLPIVALLLILVVRFIPAVSASTEEGSTRERIDLFGALLLGASLICLSLGLAQQAAQITPARPAAGTAPIENNPWLILAALVLLCGFIALELYYERRSQWPVVNLSLFKRAMFSATSIVSLLVGAALIIAMADIPIFIATVLNRSAIDSGLALLRLTAMIPVGAIVGGWLCSRITARWTAVLGLIATAAGFWLMHLWPLNVDWTQITISTMIAGSGFGLVIAPISTTAINAASERQIGMASSVVTVLRMIGMILGLAALTSWGLGRFRLLAAGFKPPVGVPAFSAQYNNLYSQYLIGAAHAVYTAIFLAAGILCIVALVPAIFLEGRKLSPYFIRSRDNRIDPLTSETESEARATHG